MIRRCFTEVHGSKAAKLEGRSFLGKKKGGKAGHGTYVLLIMCRSVDMCIQDTCVFDLNHFEWLVKSSQCFELRQTNEAAQKT